MGSDLCRHRWGHKLAGSPGAAILPRYGHNVESVLVINRESRAYKSSSGFTESIVPTAFMITVSGYYTQPEQALRQSWWFSGTGWFTIIGGGLNYGFAQIDGALKPWQYLYVFAGALTFLFGLWCFALPNSPLDAWFLTPEERLVAVERLRAGQTGVRNQTIKGMQIKEALLDAKIWLLVVMMAAA